MEKWPSLAQLEVFKQIGHFLFGPASHLSYQLLLFFEGYFCFGDLLFLGPSFTVGDESASFETVDAQYERDIFPLLKQFCLECHSTEQQEGELDLDQFGSIAQVRGDLQAWRKVIEMLEEDEMPPEDDPQLSDVQRQ